MSKRRGSRNSFKNHIKKMRKNLHNAWRTMSENKKTAAAADQNMRDRCKAAEKEKLKGAKPKATFLSDGKPSAQNDKSANFPDQSW